MEHAHRSPGRRHGFFLAFTVIFAAVVLTGFSRTFFLPLAGGTFSRPLIVHGHGALFFAWTLLLVGQSILAATRRLRLHRRLGSLAAWLIIPMLATGIWVASADTVNDYHRGEGDAALAFYYGELADLAMFGLLAGAAMLLRHRPDYHKRLVLMGSLGLIGAAIGRIPELDGWFLTIWFGLILSVFAYDIASRRRLHPATLLGTTVLLLIGLTEGPIGETGAWLGFARQVLGL